jgi:hypothetical protein
MIAFFANPLSVERIFHVWRPLHLEKLEIIDQKTTIELTGPNL